MAKKEKNNLINKAKPGINRPPMPKATAAWFILNTSLTPRQIADFCGIHYIEVQVMMDESRDMSIPPVNPVGLYITKEEISEGESNPQHKLVYSSSLLEGINVKIPKVKKYPTMAHRRERLEAIMWLLAFASGLTDGQIAKLVGSTKSTVAPLRNKSRNTTGLIPKNPVTVGLCTLDELNAQIALNNKKEENN